MKWSKKYDVMQWHTQTNNINTNLKFEVGFTLPELSATGVFHKKIRQNGHLLGGLPHIYLFFRAFHKYLYLI